MHLRSFLITAGLLVAAGFAVAQDCYESSILSPIPFMGNNGEMFKLADGSIWEVKFAYEYMYQYYPRVIICPALRKLSVNGNTISVEQVGGKRSAPSASSGKDSTSDVIESQIEGEFSGWSGDTMFKLTNGQIWQQSSYAYTYSYKYRPNVLIFRTGGGYAMQVEGLDSKIQVKRLK